MDYDDEEIRRNRITLLNAFFAREPVREDTINETCKLGEEMHELI